MLDQLWVNFDVEHRAFVTAGRQHVKWGVGKFWNPTDYLHPVKRDPLATFDVRTGTTMVKLHVPWEKRGWNFYAVALLEDAAGDTDPDAEPAGARSGGGGRAEIVLGECRAGPGRGWCRTATARGTASTSRPAIWRRRRLLRGGAAHGQGRSPLDRPGHARGRARPPHAAGGGGRDLAFKYSDEDSATVGAEYFYNDLGYDDRRIYPFLLAGAPRDRHRLERPAHHRPADPQAFQPFYLGKHYAALNLVLPQPGSWNDTTIILSGIGNLSDRSYVARLDASVLVLTYLTVETFVAVHFGQKGGEFRLAIGRENAAAAEAVTGQSFPAGAPIVDVGIALRVAL